MSAPGLGERVVVTDLDGDEVSIVPSGGTIYDASAYAAVLVTSADGADGLGSTSVGLTARGCNVLAEALTAAALARGVECPTCNATGVRRCTTPLGRFRSTWHAERLDAWGVGVSPAARRGAS